MLALVPLLAAEPQLRSVNIALAGGALVAAASAATSYLTGFGCPSYEIAGCLCAFCGGTRAVVALADGHLVTALRNNGLVVLLLGLVAVRSLLLAIGVRDRVSTADAIVERVNIWVWAAGLLVWTVARNLPWLSGLAPIS